MITKQHLISDLQTIARGGEVSDDESFTDEQVGFWIDVTRAQLIKQAVDKGKSINPDIIQTIPCLDVHHVDASECPGCEEVGCLILRTDVQLPNAVESQYKNLITRVASMRIGSIPFTFMSYERAVYTGHNPFTKDIPKAFLKDGYIYLLSNSFVQQISVSGVWEQPEDLDKYSTCDGDPCYSKDSEYPISMYMINTMKDMIKQKDFGFGLMAPTDVNNNANSEVEAKNAPTQRRR